MQPHLPSIAEFFALAGCAAVNGFLDSTGINRSHPVLDSIVSYAPVPLYI